MGVEENFFERGGNPSSARNSLPPSPRSFAFRTGLSSTLPSGWEPAVFVVVGKWVALDPFFLFFDMFLGVPML